MHTSKQYYVCTPVQRYLYNTMQYSLMQYNTAQYNSIHYNIIIQYNTVWCSTIHCTMRKENIQLDIGTPKNKNKNSVAEKAIRELRLEMVKISPQGGKLSNVILAKAVMT